MTMHTTSFREALEAYLKNDPNTAKSICIELAASQEAHKAFCLLAVIEVENDRPESALAYVRKALSRDPSYCFAYLTIGRVLYLRNRDEEALAFLKRALCLVPDNMEVREALALVYHDLAVKLMKSYSFGEALSRIEASVSLNPGLTAARLLKSRIHKCLLEHREEYRACLDAYSLEPFNHEVNSALDDIHYFLSGFLAEKGRLHDALRVNLLGLAFSPGNPDLLYDCANLHCLMREPVKMRFFLDSAFTVLPDMPERGIVSANPRIFLKSEPQTIENIGKPLFMCDAVSISERIGEVLRFFSSLQAGGDEDAPAGDLSRCPEGRNGSALPVDNPAWTPERKDADAGLIRSDTLIGRYFYPGRPRYDVIKNTVRRGRIYDAHIFDIARRYLRKDEIILDIGANMGQMSILWAGLLTTGQVYSFEASPYIFRILRKNVLANAMGERIKIFNNAVYDKSGLEVSIPGEDAGDFVTYGTYGISTTKKDGQKVKTLAVDDLSFPGRVCFMKVDVQGCDLLVLKGAEKTIRRFRMPVVFEYEEELAGGFGVSRSDCLDLIRGIKYAVVAEIVNNILIMPEEMV